MKKYSLWWQCRGEVRMRKSSGRFSLVCQLPMSLTKTGEKLMADMQEQKKMTLKKHSYRTNYFLSLKFASMFQQEAFSKLYILLYILQFSLFSFYFNLIFQFFFTTVFLCIMLGFNNLLCWNQCPIYCEDFYFHFNTFKYFRIILNLSSFPPNHSEKFNDHTYCF